MKNRYTAPFGYTFHQGQLVVHADESDIVKQVFADYLAGSSLNDIAEKLTTSGIEYLPGRSDWNKNRVKRMLEDERYLGTEQLSALIDEADFHAVQTQKHQRNDRKTIKAESHISKVTVPVVCAACNLAMTRTHNPKRKIADVWCCDCGVKVQLADEDLLAGTTEVLNLLIDAPALIKEQPQQIDETQQLEIRRLHNEINRNPTQQDIFALAAARFAAISDALAQAHMLRSVFERVVPLAGFSKELLEQTVSQVLLGDGVYLKLKNNQIVGKGDGHGTGFATTHGAGNPCAA
ncbi:MAG: recombinase family protein [Oscillospiraceae bacterium]|nr:recombinase family protein [Oscillospiraceae bacterium]